MGASGCPVQQAHQPQGWKKAGSEILRSLRVPNGVYREEKPPPAKASDGNIRTHMNRLRVKTQPELTLFRGNQVRRKIFEEAVGLFEEPFHRCACCSLLQS